MRKIYMCLVFQMFIMGSLLFSFQCFSEDQEIYVDDFGIMHATATGYIMDVHLEGFLQQIQDSVWEVLDDKIYLVPDKLLIFKGHYLLLNHQNQWIRLNEVFKDGFGFYLLAKEPKCFNGHMGFKCVGGTWYCLHDGCTYCYY